MAKLVTTRLPDDFVNKLKEISEKENLDTSAVIRRLLAGAIKEWKMKMVFEKLEAHEISIGKAAEEIGISVWGMVDLIKKYNIKWPGYSKEDLEDDLETIGWKK